MSCFANGSGHKLHADWDGGKRLGVGVVEDDAALGELVNVRCLAGGHALKDRIAPVIQANVVLAKAVQHDDDEIQGRFLGIDSPV